MKGILFDKDGTLFDFNATWGGFTKELLTDLARDPEHLGTLAEAIRFDLESARFHPDSFVIFETIHVWAEVIAPHLDFTDVDELVAHINAQNAKVRQVPATDLLPLLNGLRDQGFALGVATNDSEVPARRHLSENGLSELFDFVAGADSGYGAKPGTGQLDAFCEATGLAAADCVMIGDSLHDLHAGRAAGMTCVGVLTGPIPYDVLAPAADVVLGSIAELPDWLKAT